MENSNIKRQAKSDIFKELQPKITFYLNKGAKPNSLKKFYKNNKNFDGLLDDINYKGKNLISDDSEYKNLVREIINEILDDFINKDKDEKYNKKQMKHIKEFYSFNEGFYDVLMFFAMGWALYKFLKGYFKARRLRKSEEIDNEYIDALLEQLREIGKIPVNNLNDRYFMRVNFKDEERSLQYDLRLFKNEKKLIVDNNEGFHAELDLTDREYKEFINLIRPE